MVSPPILKREREEEHGVSPLCVTGELGSPTVKSPPNTRSPEEGGGEMDHVGGNKSVEVPNPEDSSTMEESVVTFSGQRRKEPLVGDLVSSPESVGSNMEKRENAVLGMDILVYRLERNGARENAGSNPEICFHGGRDGGHALRNGEHQTPGGVLDPVTGECYIERGRDRKQSSLQRYVSF